MCIVYELMVTSCIGLAFGWNVMISLQRNILQWPAGVRFMGHYVCELNTALWMAGGREDKFIDPILV